MNTTLSSEIKVTKLKKGDDLVKYEILNKRPDKKNKGRMIMASSTLVPSRDTILDPGDNELKAIECIDKTIPIRMKDGTAGVENKLLPILFYAANNGQITINPDSNTDRKLYEYLERTNFNLSNPHRDTDVQAMFKRLDEEGDAKKTLAKKKAVRDAVRLVEDMSIGDLRSMAKGLEGHMAVNSGDTESLLRLAMEEKAEKYPEEFIKDTAPKVDNVLLGHIHNGIEKEIIELDKRTYRWVGEEDKDERKIVSVPMGKEFEEVLVLHFLSDGAEELDRLLAELNK